MQFTTLFALASAVALGHVKAQSSSSAVTAVATPVTNPVGPTYIAVLPTGSGIQGSVSLSTAPGNTGVLVEVSFSDFPASGGPFPYHIHVSPISAPGDCASANGHLDPFNRGDTPPCDATQPQTCQVGDLSGKYGKITTDPFSATYSDPYISLVPGQPSFAGNRSIVIHRSNSTRIACANFALVSGTYTGSNATSTVTPIPYKGAAAKTVASLLSIGIVAAMVLL